MSIKKIVIHNSVYCQASKGLIRDIMPCLEYEYIQWRKRRYGSESKIKKGFFIDVKTGVFLTGLLPKVSKYLDKEKISFQVEGSPPILILENKATLPGIVLNKDQEEAVGAAIKEQRGVIHFPTGSGKTVIALALLSSFPSAKFLYLCHTVDLVKQTYNEMLKYGFKDIDIFGGGRKRKKLETRIVVSTIQTFSKFHPEEYSKYFDITVIDEVHHLSGEKTKYAEVMEHNLSHIKIGLTATLPEQKRKRLIIEGFVGPIIASLSSSLGIEKGILSKPKIVLLPVLYNTKIGEKRSYKDIYNFGIIKNRSRNGIIIKEIEKIISEEKTVLVLIKEIEHGEILRNLARDFKISAYFVHGSTSNVRRERVKKKLIQKKIKCVIASVIWKEGIDIPSLNYIINACGGKTEIPVLQKFGRGLRIDRGKKEVFFIDFLDPYRYLAEHTIRRIQIYRKEEWM